MYDEIPASRTPDESNADPSDDPSANRGPTSSRSDRTESDSDDRADPDREDDRPRDGVDPPGETERDRSERERSGTDGDRDEECDPESMEYRLERLRLWRTVVTLAVVVARLIRSL